MTVRPLNSAVARIWDCRGPSQSRRAFCVGGFGALAVQKTSRSCTETVTSRGRPLRLGSPALGVGSLLELTSATCDHPMIACWAKGRSNAARTTSASTGSGPSAAIPSARQSWRTLSKRFSGNSSLMARAAEMLHDIRHHRSQCPQHRTAQQKCALTTLNAKIGKLTDRPIETDSPAGIRAMRANFRS